MSDDVIFCTVHGGGSLASIGCDACKRERTREIERLQSSLEDSLCESEHLRAELNEAADATGIAGVDEPMSLVECIQALRAENAELKTWRKDTNLDLDRARRLLNKASTMIVEKDKRIEELEMDRAERLRVAVRNASRSVEGGER